MFNIIIIMSITVIWAFILIPGFNEYTFTIKALILWSLTIIASIIYGGGKPPHPRFEVDEFLAKILRISAIIYIVSLAFKELYKYNTQYKNTTSNIASRKYQIPRKVGTQV
jgi:hypothetical protein